MAKEKETSQEFELRRHAANNNKWRKRRERWAAYRARGIDRETLDFKRREQNAGLENE